MEQKDYKAIAEIIAKVNENTRSTDCNYIALELADYFEKEDKRGKECQRENNLGVIETYWIDLKFDKKQFLKDCWVKQ